MYLLLNRFSVGIINVVSCSGDSYYKDAVRRDFEIFFSTCAFKFDGMISLGFPTLNAAKASDF